MHNKELANLRNISKENRSHIDTLHSMLEKLISSYTLNIDYQKASELCHDMEITLAEAWGFSKEQNLRFDHTWINKLEQKWFDLTFSGRTFKCLTTGQERTIEDGDAQTCWCVKVGEGFIDFGRANQYHRIVGNIVEITEKR